MKNFILKTIVILLACLIGFGGSVVIYYLLSDEFSQKAERRAERKECEKHLKKVAYIAKMTGKTSILEIEGQLNETTACSIDCGHWGYQKGNRTINCKTHNIEIKYTTEL